MPRYDPGAPPAPKKKTPWWDPYPHGPYRVPNDPDTGGSTYYPGGVDNPNPPAPPQPQGPQPPPPGTPPPAPPQPIDWNALITQDPQYIAELASLTRQRHDALVNYGDASGIPGADASTAAEAANNPYSVTSLLRQQLATDQRHLATSANAHGVLFSGAEAQNQQNEQNAGLQRSFSAAERLQSMLGGYGDQQQAAYAAAYNRLAANPPPSPADPTAPPAADPNAPADPNNTAPPAPATNRYLPGAPPGFKPPAPPRPLSTKPSVKRSGPVAGPRPARATHVLPTRYG